MRGMANDLLEDLLERDEAAKKLRISLRTLESEISKGNLPVVRIGRSVRIRPTAIALYVEARESRGPRKKKLAKKPKLPPEGAASGAK
jgi:excisionase family DNA binding protein